jgi:hypothetical protein
MIRFKTEIALLSEKTFFINMGVDNVDSPLGITITMISVIVMPKLKPDKLIK